MPFKFKNIFKIVVIERIFSCLCLILITFSCSSQEAHIVSKKNLGPLSNFPFYYEKTRTNKEGKDILLPEYQFLDSIQISNITYLSDGLKVKGVIVEPIKKGKYPAVIFNRGGNLEFGAINLNFSAKVLAKLAKEGYVVIASQYRGNMDGEGKDEFGGSEINDVLNLIPIAEKLPNVDYTKIGMYGWSRGGMMTYLALSKTNKLRAAVVGGAVSDMSALVKDRPEMETDVLSKLVPGYKTNTAEELSKRSAIEWVDKFPKETPVLMLHGTADWRVKPEQSLQMALQFEKYRIPYRLVMFEGGDHAIREHRNEVDQQVLNWFNKYLKNETVLPNMEYHGR